MNPVAPLEQQPEQRPDKEKRFEFPREFLRMRAHERRLGEDRQRATWTAEKLRYRHYVRGGLPMDVMMQTRRMAKRYWWVPLMAYWMWRF